MNETQYISDFLAPRDAWDKLSIEEQAAMMKTAVSEGILDLGTIRQKYNEFAEGGNTDDDLVDWIIREEGFIANPKDIGDGKMTLGSGLTAQKWHDQYKRNGNKWTSSDNRRAVREEVANRRRWAEKNIPNWDSLPSSSQKALLSYKYNYDFNQANSPKLFKALSDSNLQEAARQMDATSSNPVFKKGLQDRRQREQEWFLRDVASSQVPNTFYQPAVSTQVYNPYVQQVETTRVLPINEPDPNSYIRTIEVSPQEQRRRKFQENVEAFQRFNALMDLIDLRNNPAPSYNPIYSLFGDNTEGFAKGGKIHINPSKKGTFTAAASKHGMGVQQFASRVLAHPENYSPAMRKKANFAKNAAKWKHGLGGNLFSGEENYSQQMQLGPRYWADQTIYHDWQNNTIDGGTLPEVIVSPTNDASWLFSTGKYVHNPRKPLADKHTRKVVSGYLSKFDNESARDYNERISRLADVLDIRGVQFKKNNVESGKLKGRAHYIDNSGTAYIDSMEDIFAEVAHPWQYAKGNNNIEEEVGTGKYDSDNDPRGGTRYAYPDTAEGETHAFFEPVLTEWIETGKIGKSSPILNNELSRQKIKPKDRMEVGDSASSWNRQAIERRLLANPDQLPLHKRIQYGLFDYPLLDKKKNGFGGNLFDGTSQPSQKMKIGRPYYSYDENGRKIDDTLNYNISFPEVVIIPDSKKSPAERAILERERRRAHDAYFGNGTYNAKADREQTELEKIVSQKAWENSVEKQALDYAQAAASGIGIGADIVSGLPVYSSLKGARVLSGAKAPLDYIEGGLWLTPLFSEAYQTAKPMVTTAVNDIFTNHPALYQYPRYVMGKLKYGMDAELPTVFRKFNTLPKIENGKVVISNPNSRFAYDNGFGEQSPIITNFTTDAPVRSHSAGNWDRDLTLAFPGKKLLGKRVISTQPSDTFTFGDNITIPTKDITGFSGRQKELNYLESNGMKSITSPEAEVFWKSGASDLASKIAQARTTNAKIFQNRGKGIVLLKPKTPYGDFSNYANTIENLTRETFKSPTLKDYQFMDYVFRPKFTSDVAPKVENFTFDFINKNPIFGEWLGNSERRTYLNQPWRWGNLMYDPLTPVESEFRSELNIGLKPEFKR